MMSGARRGFGLQPPGTRLYAPAPPSQEPIVFTRGSAGSVGAGELANARLVLAYLIPVLEIP